MSWLGKRTRDKAKLGQRERNQVKVKLTVDITIGRCFI